MLSGATTMDVPIEIYNNLVIVPVTINQKITLRFVLDTGVSHIILTEKRLADTIGLVYDRAISITPPGVEDTLKAFVANDVGITIEGYVPQEYNAFNEVQDLHDAVSNPTIIGQKQTLMVLEEDFLDLTGNLGTEVYGIIGYPLFRSFVVEVNQNKKVASFTVPQFWERPNHYDRLKIDIENGKPYVDASITSTEAIDFNAKLLLDLGASHALLLNTQTFTEFDLPGETIAASLGHGLGGEILGKIGRIAQIDFGGVTFENVITSFPQTGYYLPSWQINKRQGTIGGDILKRYNLAFHYRDSSVYYARSFYYNKKFEYDMSGLDYRIGGQDLDKMVVIGVKEGSPVEEAGLEFGDVITKVNSFKILPENMDDIVNLLRLKPGKTIKLTVLRGEEELKISFDLRRMI